MGETKTKNNELTQELDKQQNDNQNKIDELNKKHVELLKTATENVTVELNAKFETEKMELIQKQEKILTQL